MVRYRPLVLLTLALHAAVLSVGVAQDSTERLDAIRADVAAHSKTLSTLQQERKSLKSQLTQLSAEIERLRAEEFTLSEERKRGQQKTEKLTKQVHALRERMERLERISLDRVKAMYVARPAAVSAQVLIRGDMRSTSRDAYYLAKVRQFDRDTLRELDSLRRKSKKRTEELTRQIEEQRNLENELREQRGEIVSQVKKKEALLTEVAHKAHEVEASLTALRAQALRLETVVKSLTVTPGMRQPKRRTGSFDHVQRPQPFEGKGLKSDRGALRLPLDGHIIRHFGKHKVDGFDDIVLSKGIEIASESAKDVQAVAPGRVLYLGRMPGYDTIIILDHGKRYYTLYGKLDETFVELGENLSAGAIIARASQEGPHAGRLYFEIRKSGTPIDPEKYLR